MTVTCPECFAAVKLPAAAAGKKVRCKTCGGVFRAAAEPSAAAPTRRSAKRTKRVKKAGDPAVAALARRWATIAAAVCGGAALLGWVAFLVSRGEGGPAAFAGAAGTALTALFFLGLAGSLVGAVAVVATAPGGRDGRGEALRFGGALAAAAAAAFLLHPAHWEPVVEAVAAGRTAGGTDGPSMRSEGSREDLGRRWEKNEPHPSGIDGPGGPEGLKGVGGFLRPTPTGAEERREAQRDLERFLAWNGTPRGTTTVTRSANRTDIRSGNSRTTISRNGASVRSIPGVDDGDDAPGAVTLRWNVGPSAGGFGGAGGGSTPPPISYPVRGLRVRRARWDGRACVAEVVPLRGSRDVGGEYPGEEAVAAPSGYKLGGADVAFGAYVYAVRPLWVPEGAPAGDAEAAGTIKEGPWLGDRGEHVVARLLPPARNHFGGFAGRSGRALDSLAILYSATPPPTDASAAAAVLGPLSRFELWPWGADPPAAPAAPPVEPPAAAEPAEEPDAEPPDFSGADWPDP